MSEVGCVPVVPIGLFHASQKGNSPLILQRSVAPSLEKRQKKQVEIEANSVVLKIVMQFVH